MDVYVAAAPAPALTRVFQGKGSKTYHDVHRGIVPVRWFDSAKAARAAGLRPCKVCRP